MPRHGICCLFQFGFYSISWTPATAAPTRLYHLPLFHGRLPLARFTGAATNRCIQPAVPFHCLRAAALPKHFPCWLHGSKRRALRVAWRATARSTVHAPSSATGSPFNAFPCCLIVTFLGVWRRHFRFIVTYFIQLSCCWTPLIYILFVIPILLLHYLYCSDGWMIVHCCYCTGRYPA